MDRLQSRILSIIARAGGIVWFVGHYLAELGRSGWRVALDVASPGSEARPGIVHVPLDARTDAEIALVANLISLTPGTLAVDVDPLCRTLEVHVMFIDEGKEDEVVQYLKDTVERPVLDLVR
jgi:multicomponent Na+:H+ antiporter subunit E